MFKFFGICVGLLMLAALSRPMLAAEATSRPNFLFIFSDDQRWDALGVVQKEQGDKARFPWLKTPNLDRMAAEGIRFRNAFVVNSLCAPSRASMMTGCYGHVNGVVNNHTPFPETNATVATLLRPAGYVSGYVGKWHMGSQRGKRTGFDFSASFIGQGIYVDCNIEVNGTPTPSKGWVDDVSTDYAKQFITENKAKPWVLMVGYKAAHGPFSPPPRWANAYEGEEARPVPNLDSTAIYKQGGPAAGGPRSRNTNLGYFRCLSAMDENVGKLLSTLDQLGIADNTMVVFAGDNGYYFGEHGLGDKRSAYEESMRIPLLVRYPKLAVKGKAIDQIALNIDPAATFLDYAVVPVPQQMHGRSWRPLFDGRPEDWRKAFFYCYFGERGFAVPTVQAVRTETAKLVRYPGHEDWTEVFDLTNDPYEMKNLAKDPATESLRKSLELEFDKQAKAINFQIPDYADKEPAAGAESKALKAWVLDYRFDKDEGEKVADASGKNNHGQNTGTTVVTGRDGAKARHFDGKSFIEVPKSPSLDPAGIAWTINVVFKAEKEDGVILARGGASQGYCLYLEKGRLNFTVTAGKKTRTIVGKESRTGQWTDVTARIASDGKLALWIGGKEVAQSRQPAMIGNDPRESMQIGADRGSKVLEGKILPDFTGDIQRVRLYSGEAP